MLKSISSYLNAVKDMSHEFGCVLIDRNELMPDESKSKGFLYVVRNCVCLLFVKSLEQIPWICSHCLVFTACFNVYF